ncbi:MAG: regulatory protein RecX [Ruminococcaceae bacterium]|nr:regulatory protein RecX [Oscillospiraceae bacterium]
MTVTDIKREKKHLCRIVFSAGKEVLLDLDIVSEYAIHKDDTLSEQKLLEIIEASDYYRAKQRALWYLDRAAHTEKGLYDKLIKAGFKAKVSAKVIARFCELGLLDDRRYAENFAERCISANISKRETYRKLILKGIPKDLANEVLEENEVDELSQIRQLIDKKYRLKLENPENTQKVYAALIRKGFSFSAVRDALKSYSEELLLAQEEFSEEF